MKSKSITISYFLFLSLIYCALISTSTLSFLAFLGDVTWSPIHGELSPESFQNRATVALSWLAAGVIPLGLISHGVKALLKKGVLPEPQMTMDQYQGMIQWIIVVSVIAFIATLIMAFRF